MGDEEEGEGRSGGRGGTDMGGVSAASLFCVYIQS